MEELLRILVKWLKTIIGVTAIAAVISAGISLVLPHYYKSVAVFRVSNPYMMDRTSLFNTEGGDNPVYLFGGQDDMNRIITLSESSELQNYLINKYSLYEHYDIDSTDVLAEFLIKEELKDYLRVRKTPKNMLEVEMMDKDKQLASDIANDVVGKLDELNKKIVKEKKYDLLALYEKELPKKLDKLNMLRDSLVNTLTRNEEDTITANVLEKMVESAVGEYANLRIITDQQTAALNQPYSSVYIIEQAQPALKRAKPVRSLIVISATLATLVAMILICIFIEKFRQYQLLEKEP